MVQDKIMKKITVCIFLALLVAGCSSEPETTKVWIPGWKEAASLNIPRAGAATVISGNVIYVLGGVDGRNF